MMCRWKEIWLNWNNSKLLISRKPFGRRNPYWIGILMGTETQIFSIKLLTLDRLLNECLFLRMVRILLMI